MDYSQIPLRDMHTPDMISWWPLAYGWWLLIISLIIIVVFCGCYLRKKLSDPRRYALEELKLLEQNFLQDQDGKRLVMQSNALLKRLALSLYPREQVAPLSGARWCHFLQETGAAPDSAVLDVLAQGPYQEQHSGTIDGAALIKFSRLWIKQVKGASHA
ncbi:DUF4381 domain-containing protein [Neptuniibacter marinus]|uniref:DUF4381 domain-containing protein n=1 Tax=Neptuniibacter marinus TaxID=1806670 RepID=UPI00082D5575|nr:DUF4381 domain-containing protein [Neptuniibacter marinus]